MIYQLWKLVLIPQFSGKFGDISYLFLKLLSQPMEIIDDKSTGELIMDNLPDARNMDRVSCRQILGGWLISQVSNYSPDAGGFPVPDCPSRMTGFPGRRMSSRISL